jgi:hypothetical protein
VYKFKEDKKGYFRHLEIGSGNKDVQYFLKKIDRITAEMDKTNSIVAEHDRFVEAEAQTAEKE